VSARAVPVAVVFGGMLLTGCGAAAGADAERTAHGSITLAQARSLNDYPLVYAGERVAGYPLAAVLHRDDTARYVSFVYGDCEPAELEGGCAPPVEIQVWPAAARRPGFYVPYPAGLGSPAPDPTTIRGLPAAFVGDGQLELYAEQATVVVFSGSRDRVLAVAAALRCLHDTTLPPRAGTLEC
jgi:hypothetical protein